MNYLDIIIAVPLLYGLIKGFSNGLVKEITGLLGLIIGVYVAINFSSYLHPRFTEFLGGYEQFVPIISFVTLLFVSILVIRLLGYFLDKLTKALALGIISRILGAIFGFFKIVVFFSFLLFIVTEYGLINTQTQKESVLLKPLKDVAKIITPEINKHKDTFLDKVEKNTNKAKEEIEKKVNTQ
jgi:membrane protein required for colicin V production